MYAVIPGIMIFSKSSIQVNPRCYKCEVTSYYLKEYADLEKLLVQEEAVWVPLLSTEHLFVLGDRVESFVPYWAGWSSMTFKDVTLK